MVVNAGLPAGTILDPFFDAAWLIAPNWFWILFIELFVGFTIVIGMIYIWFIMRPVAGYGNVGDAATAKGSPTQTYSIWKNRSFVISSMWYYGNVLAYGNPLKQMQMWFHNSEKATGVAASKPVMITRDGFNGTVDLIAEMAMCEIPKIWNERFGIEKVQRKDPDTGLPMFDASNKPIMVDQERKDNNGKSLVISSFSDILDKWRILQAKFPNGIPIPAYKLYDLSEVYQWTPQDEDSLKFGADIVEEAKEWAKEDDKDKPGFMDKYGFFIICAIIGFGSMGALAYILHLV
jgi:hypothetical protein